MKHKVAIRADAGDIAAFLVCRELTIPLLFSDNLLGECSRCGATVQFRPHAPTKPPKLCTACFVDELTEGPDIVVTPETVAELKDFAKKRSH